MLKSIGDFPIKIGSRSIQPPTASPGYIPDHIPPSGTYPHTGSFLRRRTLAAPCLTCTVGIPLRRKRMTGDAIRPPCQRHAARFTSAPTARTRIQAPFHRVIFTGFLHWGIAWIRPRSALQTLLNTVIILRRKNVKLYRIMVVILRKSVTGPEKEGKRSPQRARMGDARPDSVR